MREVYFFVLQCWKSKWPTAKMQVTFTSTITNGKRTSILPLQILQITVCITCCLQSEKKKNIYIYKVFDAVVAELSIHKLKN